MNRDVREWLEIGQPTASRLVAELLRNGFAIESGKERTAGVKRPVAYYTLTGAARLAFGNF